MTYETPLLIYKPVIEPLLIMTPKKQRATTKARVGFRFSVYILLSHKHWVCVSVQMWNHQDPRQATSQIFESAEKKKFNINNVLPHHSNCNNLNRIRIESNGIPKRGREAAGSKGVGAADDRWRQLRYGWRTTNGGLTRRADDVGLAVWVFVC